MTIRIFNARKVADDISKNVISPKEKAYYLLGTFLLFIPFYYSGFVYSNPLWSWLSIYEAIVIIFITVVGLNKTYEAAGADSNQNFVTEFTCLYVPVSITTIFLVWLSYWSIGYAFRESLINLSSSHLEIAVKLSNIGSDLFGLLIFLASVFIPSITFYRIKKLFHVIQHNRG
jgi:hypothetical protein